MLCLENEPEAQCAQMKLSAPTVVQQHRAQTFKGEGTEKQAVVGEVEESSPLYE